MRVGELGELSGAGRGLDTERDVTILAWGILTGT